MASTYQIGKWQVLRAGGINPVGGGESSEARTLEAGGIGDTLAALTLAEARVASTRDPERAAGAAEDAMFQPVVEEKPRPREPQAVTETAEAKAPDVGEDVMAEESPPAEHVSMKNDTPEMGDTVRCRRALRALLA